MTSSYQFANYDKKLISILEILGSQFVDVYYNHVYNSAQTHLDPGGSQTDEYVRRVKAYIIAVKTYEKCYCEVVQNLYKYFQMTIGRTALSFADFVEQIVQQFIPKEYYNLLGASEKDEALESIVVDLVSTLGVYVTSPDMLLRIIDGHDVKPGATIRKIQDQAVNILLAKRGAIHNSFLSRLGQAKDTVSIDTVDDLKNKNRELKKNKAILKALLGRVEEKRRALSDELIALKGVNSKLRKLVHMMTVAREKGLPAAAFAATVPDCNYHAEVAPSEFRGAAPPPRAEHIAEVRPGARGASFFADSSPFFGASAPPEAYKGLPPRLEPATVSGAARARRATNISDLMTATGDGDGERQRIEDYDEGEDEEEEESGDGSDEEE